MVILDVAYLARHAPSENTNHDGMACVGWSPIVHEWVAFLAESLPSALRQAFVRVDSNANSSASITLTWGLFSPIGAKIVAVESWASHNIMNFSCFAVVHYCLRVD
jgi:hypothetical protein